jgi:hypothetical protein
MDQHLRQERGKKNKNQQKRGSAKQVPALGAIESQKVESQDMNSPNRKMNRLKMKMMEGLT